VPEYDERPAKDAKVISSLAGVDEWTIEAERDPVLEFYGMMQPRRKGDFEFAAAAEFEGRKEILRVTPRPIKVGKDTMPMYAALAHKQGIKLDGVPTSLGLWVNGNSSQGRIIFELEDASGQRWTNIGAPSADPKPPYWLEKIVPAELRARFNPLKLADWNTEDVFGISRIDFDGWRWIDFPLPGHYPGEGYHWPINSQWRWDKDGKVHYPLSFRRLIVELPEKTLHVRTFAPAPRPEIYLKDLTVSY
jgi:hypothetical protein